LLAKYAAVEATEPPRRWRKPGTASADSGRSPGLGAPVGAGADSEGPLIASDGYLRLRLAAPVPRMAALMGPPIDRKTWRLT
jgi:hypothetical protein